MIIATALASVGILAFVAFVLSVGWPQTQVELVARESELTEPLIGAIATTSGNFPASPELMSQAGPGRNIEVRSGWFGKGAKVIGVL